MCILTKNGKALIISGGTLNMNSLIDKANAVTGKNDKTLSSAIDSLIEGYRQGGDNK